MTGATGGTTNGRWTRKPFIGKRRGVWRLVSVSLTPATFDLYLKKVYMKMA
jgi:hypothetical protein